MTQDKIYVIEIVPLIFFFFLFFPARLRLFYYFFLFSIMCSNYEHNNEPKNEWKKR